MGTKNINEDVQGKKKRELKINYYTNKNSEIYNILMNG